MDRRIDYPSLGDGVGAKKGLPAVPLISLIVASISLSAVLVAVAVHAKEAEKWVSAERLAKAAIDLSFVSVPLSLLGFGHLLGKIAFALALLTILVLISV